MAERHPTVLPARHRPSGRPTMRQGHLAVHEKAIGGFFLLVGVYLLFFGYGTPWVAPVLGSLFLLSAVLCCGGRLKGRPATAVTSLVFAFLLFLPGGEPFLSLEGGARVVDTYLLLVGAALTVSGLRRVL